MKLKTHKIASKRVWFTKGGKTRKRKAGQDHFNTRESSKTTRLKRLDVSMNPTDAKNLRKLLPYA